MSTQYVLTNPQGAQLTATFSDDAINAGSASLWLNQEIQNGYSSIQAFPLPSQPASTSTANPSTSVTTVSNPYAVAAGTQGGGQPVQQQVSAPLPTAVGFGVSPLVIAAPQTYMSDTEPDYSQPTTLEIYPAPTPAPVPFALPVSQALNQPYQAAGVPTSASTSTPAAAQGWNPLAVGLGLWVLYELFR